MTPTEAATMTTDQLRDWCAQDDVVPRPYPPTRDGAAAAFPEGWKWDREFHYWSAFRTVDAKTCGPIDVEPGGYIVDTSTIVTIPDTGDEIADRYRLAVLCRIAEKEATNGKA